MGAVSSGFVPFEGMQPPEKRSMKTKDLIDAADVKAIAAAAEAEAVKNNWPVTIASCRRRFCHKRPPLVG